MRTFVKWLVNHGPTLAAALDVHRETICAQSSARMAMEFPGMCDDPARPDGQTFQHSAFQRTPQRLHAMMQTALRFRSLNVVEREYRWLWGMAPRYGVTREHLLAMVHAYFEAARQSIPREASIYPVLDECETAMLELIRDVTADEVVFSQ